MSSIVIKGNTSGQVEIAAPDVAGSTTLTLPTGNGTVITDTAPKAGNVIQVVSNEYSTTTGIGSTTYADSGITATITPSSASSKILIMVSISGRVYSQQNGDRYYYQNIVRGATQIYENTLILQSGTGSLGYAVYPIKDMAYLDSPSTTSSITYKVQFKENNIANDTRMRINESGGSSTMILMEVAG